ncbi:endonuclease MutS2 [Zhenpiania hominis]|uniref:Endonuclease MutS2 n=1 Tax=Zhenpiania hominis TaxID=2763644 RepID=A0A923NJZ6_9FIRM|nr:endonuclease MutS2 [Zhenpiania hominis]MBC6680506.1 endonuclease MutS2 [Zhenpiania hominis]
MREKTIRILEYNKILTKLEEQAGSEMAKKVVSGLRPFHEIPVIRDMLMETTEAVRLILHKGPLPLGGFYDIEDSLHRARKGGSLTMKQLLQIHFNLSLARRVTTFLKSDLPPLPVIQSIGEVIAVHKNLEDEIDRCILSEDEMADNASPELKQIRRAILRQNDALKSKINHIINSAENRTMLQDAIVTVRDGRYVIPVKQEHRGKFPGIVHDQSSTGATVFIEPQVIVNLNNELRQLELQEKAEIERILAELTARVAEHYHDLLNNQKLLVQLDVIMAKGKLSMLQHGEEPQISEDGELVLKEARHPLLDPKKVVPIDLSIGGSYNTLVITGPNTGGKTVTLKTAGLLSMMAQTGLHIPAAGGSRIPVWKDIFADIGDEQSIEQSLSTFSSHMTNIVDIVKHAGEGCLVLVDELGAGTDPTEGAALAIAILEDLEKKGAATIATTHYTELKKYAISTEGVENASMEFNVETLSPTYRLAIGVPGKSNAFEISQKLGLPGEIIETSRRLLDGGDIQFEEVISALEADKKAAEEERDEAVRLNQEMKIRKEELEQQAKKLEEKKTEILNKAKEEARQILQEAKDVSKEVQEELRELKKIESLGQRNRIFDENRKKLRDAAGKYREKVIREVNDNPVSAEELRLGDRVKVLSLGQNGEIVTLPDEKGELTVQVGILKAKVNLDDIMLIEGGALDVNRPRKVRKNYGSMYKTKTQNVSISIDVRGKSLDDAVMDVDKYLDDATMAGLKEVTIIHGRGEGILRKGLQEMMRSHKHVKRFRKGNFDEGGDGVTVVTLK